MEAKTTPSYIHVYEPTDDVSLASWLDRMAQENKLVFFVTPEKTWSNKEKRLIDVLNSSNKKYELCDVSRLLGKQIPQEPMMKESYDKSVVEVL